MIASWDDFMDAVDALPYRYLQMQVRNQFDMEVRKQQRAAQRARLSVIPQGTEE